VLLHNLIVCLFLVSHTCTVADLIRKVLCGGSTNLLTSKLQLMYYCVEFIFKCLKIPDEENTFVLLTD